MILVIDVDYKDSNNTAGVAGLLFNNFEDISYSRKIELIVKDILPYESGSFYKRELPCILALLKEVSENLDFIIVDGYVFLDNNLDGLGAHLFKEVNIPIIGVAKNAYKGISEDKLIFRGISKKPLYITSIGIDLSCAKTAIQSMAGNYRLPTLLKDVDRLCRDINKG